MLQDSDYGVIEALFTGGQALFYLVLLVAGVILTVFLVRFLVVATKAAQVYLDAHGTDRRTAGENRVGSESRGI
jgi:hypothetical protein